MKCIWLRRFTTRDYEIINVEGIIAFELIEIECLNVVNS